MMTGMIFIKLDDISNDLIWLDNDPAYENSIPQDERCFYVIPKASVELEQWFSDNHIEYEMCGTHIDSKNFWEDLGIRFNKNSDAVLFKLRWL